MRFLERFTRVSKRCRCPECRHADWCLVEFGGSGDVIACVCPRTRSDRRHGDAGYLHVYRADYDLNRPDLGARRSELPVHGPGPFADRADAAHRRLADSSQLAQVSAELGLSTSALLRLRAGVEHGHLTFPMTSASGAVIGIRTRSRSGRKRAARGSKNALFVPEDLNGSGALFICEGPTDTAAMLSIGLEAIGRPSCNGGTSHVVSLVRKVAPRQVVVVADPDGPGLSGAGDLAAVLRTIAASVALIAPPASVGDVRAWIRAGARAADVVDLVKASTPVGLQTHGGGR